MAVLTAAVRTAGGSGGGRSGGAAMPYIDDWADFQAQAEALCRSRLLHTRYVLKYRHCDGRVVLKVTDDVTVSDLLPNHPCFEVFVRKDFNAVLKYRLCDGRLVLKVASDIVVSSC